MSTKKSAEIPWTEKHYKAACIEWYSMTLSEARTGTVSIANDMADAARFYSTSERHCREGLALFLPTEREVEKTIRRIRARVEGREIVEKETFHRVRLSKGYLAARNDDERDVGPEEAYTSVDRLPAALARADAAARAGVAEAEVVRVRITRRRWRRKAES